MTSRHLAGHPVGQAAGRLAGCLAGCLAGHPMGCPAGIRRCVWLGSWVHERSLLGHREGSPAAPSVAAYGCVGVSLLGQVGRQQGQCVLIFKT